MHGDRSGWWTRRRLSRRGLIAAGGAGMAITALACASKNAGGGQTAAKQPSSQASAGAPQPGGTLNVSVNFNPMLDPQKQSSVQLQGSGGVMQRLFRFKTGADPTVGLNHEIENAMAASVESPDAITWTIKLRPGVKFQNIAPVNGHALETDDVKSSFLRALDPATGSPNAGGLDMIDKTQIQTPDAQTVIFKLKYPYAPFRSLLASPAYSMIYPREAYAGAYDPARQAIGTGPFTLDSATPDVAYIYKKNPDYWEKGLPYVDQVKLAVITDDSTALAQLTAHNLDALSVSVQNLPTALQGDPTATHLRIANAGPSPVYFQMGDPTSPFLDARLRQAVAQAIDRDALGKTLYAGDYQSVVFVPAYDGKWALDVKQLPADSAAFYKYDPAAVKKLLDASGNTGKTFRYVRLTNGPFNSAASAQAAETVNAMLNQAGIKTNIVVQDYFKDFVDAGKGSRQGYFDKDMICYFAASVYNDPDDWLFSYFHSKSTSNQEHLSDPTYDAMVDKERSLVNDDDRLKAVQDIQKYIASKIYAPMTAGGYAHVLVAPRVQNYQYTATSAQMEETYAKVWLKS
jgi:peptide/nickel transport system substrate-binding protein